MVAFYTVNTLKYSEFIVADAVAQRCSVKKMFLEISQNSQENTCGEPLFK